MKTYFLYLGSVTCYLQPKLFKSNSKGTYTTEELWMPIKDITTTVKKPNNDNNNNVSSYVDVMFLKIQNS